MTENRTDVDVSKAKAVGHIPSGLFIVCSNDGNTKDGYLASWVQQVSFSPLMVAVAIGKGRPGYDHIMSGETFTINIVGKHDMNYLKHFWSGYSPEENPFNGTLDISETENGGVILNGAKSTIECRMVSNTEPGDHEIVFAEVINSYVQNEEAEVKTHVRKSGLDY
ncbi:MAG: hypothetical protein CME69_07015 [Halobacteriovorax sp.]|nr:hypothetical protein [Halobacteriovorax sp.]MEE3079659.1 flavin reductase family protein [Bdellovibrionota bacterium]